MRLIAKAHSLGMIGGGYFATEKVKEIPFIKIDDNNVVIKSWWGLEETNFRGKIWAFLSITDFVARCEPHWFDLREKGNTLTKEEQSHLINGGDFTSEITEKINKKTEFRNFSIFEGTSEIATDKKYTRGVIFDCNDYNVPYNENLGIGLIRQVEI